jgi:hypothetical protein
MRTGRGAVNEENGRDKANTEGGVETYQLSQTLLERGGEETDHRAHFYELSKRSDLLEAGNSRR